MLHLGCHSPLGQCKYEHMTSFCVVETERVCCCLPLLDTVRIIGNIAPTDDDLLTNINHWPLILIHFQRNFNMTISGLQQPYVFRDVFLKVKEIINAASSRTSNDQEVAITRSG